MSVQDILRNKGNKVFSVSDKSKIREAIAMLNEHNIGVVLVMNKSDKLVGILSERDIIRRSLTQETGFRDELVSKSMTKNVLTVPPTATLDQVMEIMTNSRIRHVPILDGDKVVGLISIGDVVKKKIADTEQEAAALRDYISS